MNRGAYPGLPRGLRRTLQPSFSGARYIYGGVAAAASFPSSTSVAPTWDTKVFDLESYLDPQVPTRFKLPRDGMYRAGGTIAVPMGGGTTGGVQLAYYKKTDGSRKVIAEAMIGNVVTWIPSVSAVFPGVAGDYVQLEAYQQTGATQTLGFSGTVDVDESIVVFWIHRLTL